MFLKKHNVLAASFVNICRLNAVVWVKTQYYSLDYSLG